MNDMTDEEAKAMVEMMIKLKAISPADGLSILLNRGNVIEVDSYVKTNRPSLMEGNASDHQ